MSTVKIQVYPVNFRTEVMVDNKFAYQTGIHPQIERENIKVLLNLIGIENVEVTDKERV